MRSARSRRTRSSGTRPPVPTGRSCRGPSRVFTDGAFGPDAPIQPVPVDEPPPGGQFPDPRWWQYRTGWNLPTQPGSEGLKLASFDQLYTLANRYSVARACIELRKEEIRGLEWEIQLTTQAAKAYQGDSKAMRDFGERAAEATRFFKNPDPDYWNFGSFLDAVLEEIFVYDALCLVFRPKYGKGLGRGLLGSDLDSIRLVSGPDHPAPAGHARRQAPPARRPLISSSSSAYPGAITRPLSRAPTLTITALPGPRSTPFRADTMLYSPLPGPPRDSLRVPAGRAGFAADHLRACRSRSSNSPTSRKAQFPASTSPPATRI